MTIAVLPARLANQIAAGEVVERPASVVKELIENSLDAGATKLHIDIEKGGSKRIRIIDNGCGIEKDELCLALSRHATSKIKTLDDLERIASLGFRGEALASISSVSRLILISKPKSQSSAWQASAEGRDMAVKIQPAAHPDGTTIEVQDLFFNTPARRKFLRTEKTEFTHIDEVIRRIALARFDVAITLTHNGKTVRQYPALHDKKLYSKRVAKICGQKFIDHAITVDCQHEGLTLWGWIAQPDFYRSQNDLSYSYVNGRMMRDKLINHAIRQAYTDRLPHEAYPAFVLYFHLDHHDVDVNVHPAKHEVRFHQARYVHDFIYSVVHQALMSAQNSLDALAATNTVATPPITVRDDHLNEASVTETQRDYITPLRYVNEKTAEQYNARQAASSVHKAPARIESLLSASQAYQALLTTPAVDPVETKHAITNPDSLSGEHYQVLTLLQDHYALIEQQAATEKILLLVAVMPFALFKEQMQLQQRWQSGLTSQPLLLPQQLEFSRDEVQWLNKQQALMQQAGIFYQVKDATHIQVRQFPAYLRQHNVQKALTDLVEKLKIIKNQALSGKDYCQALASIGLNTDFTPQSVQNLFNQLQIEQNDKFKQLIDLNSVSVDLTSLLSKLN